ITEACDKALILEATIAVLGLVYHKDKGLVARFSDIACHPSIFGDAYRGPVPVPISIRKEYEYQVIPSGYETQIDLPPGDYDLSLVVTDGEKFGRVEAPLGESGAVKLQFQMRVTDAKTGEVKAETGMRPVASGTRLGNPVIPVWEEIAIDKLPSGTYRLEVQASDSAGKSTVWRAASFTVE